MGRWVPPAVEGYAPGSGDVPESDRCPRCGAGELLGIAIGGSRGEARRAVYCAGLYDRDRRRFVRRSCGYSRHLEPVTTLERSFTGAPARRIAPATL